jgi:hypothetical protein
MNDDPIQVWFPEPSAADNTWARRGESTPSWLARSTKPRAKEFRRFLNEHLSKLPLQNQEMLVHDLHHKWNSAFFELIVARILQETGGDIQIEASNAEGRRPDFISCFPDMKVVVEAKAPVLNAKLGEELSANIKLLDYIESKIPQGWIVGVYKLPHIGPSDSMREFKRTIDEILCLDPPGEEAQSFEINSTISSGAIVLHLAPADFPFNGLYAEGSCSCFNDSREKIKRAVKSKRSQVRSSSHPVILAVLGGELESSWESFDRALFGSAVAVIGPGHTITGQDFCEDGIFNSSGKNEPVIAGVLAFRDLNFKYVRPPVLYRHPRFTGKFPEAMLSFEQRRYNANLKRIEMAPAKPESMPDLHLVTV